MQGLDKHYRMMVDDSQDKESSSKDSSLISSLLKLQDVGNLSTLKVPTLRSDREEEISLNQTSNNIPSEMNPNMQQKQLKKKLWKIFGDDQKLKDYKNYFRIEEQQQQFDDCDQNSFQVWIKVVQRILLQFLCSFIKEFCRIISKSDTFELIIVVIIFLNTVQIIILEDNSFEEYFLISYTIEAAIKIIGNGFIFNYGSYLRDRSNILDFIVLISAWVSYQFQDSVDLKSVRIIRILRPLKSVSAIQGLRILFLSLVYSVKLLASNITLLFFYIFLFSAAGLNLFMGILDQQCLNVSTGFYSEDFCGDKECQSGYECVENPLRNIFQTISFDNILYALLTSFQCITLGGWTFIMMRYQDTFSQFVAIFFIILVFFGLFFFLNLTLAVIKFSFTTVMNNIEDQLKQDVYSELKKQYFKELEKIKEKEQYIQENKIVRQMTLAKQNSTSPDLNANFLNNSNLTQSFIKRFQLKQLANNFKIGDDTFIEKDLEVQTPRSDEQTSLMKQISDQQPKTSIKLPKIKEKQYNTSAVRVPVWNTRVDKAVQIISKFGDIRIRKQCQKLQKKFLQEVINENYQRSEFDHQQLIIITYLLYPYILFDEYLVGYIINGGRFKNPMLKINNGFEQEYSSTNDVLQTNDAKVKKGKRKENMAMCQYMVYHCKHTIKSAFQKIEGQVKSRILEKLQKDNDSKHTIQTAQSIKYHTDIEKLNVILQKLNKQINQNTLLIRINNSKFYFRRFIETRKFQQCMIIIILINTVSLSLYYDEMPTDFENSLDIINYSIAVLFILEISLKVYAYSIKQYFRHTMNVIDFIIAMASIIDFILLVIYADKLHQERKVLVSIRALRILRIFRYIESMKTISKVIKSSLSSFIYLGLLLLLFTVIFSLLGLEIFKEDWKNTPNLDRARFSTFSQSFLTVFQLITLDNWQNMLYTGVNAKGPWSSLFFIFCIFIGNIVLLNLFIAILLDAFSDETDILSTYDEGRQSSTIVMTKETKKKHLLIQELSESEINHIAKQKIKEQSDKLKQQMGFSSISMHQKVFSRVACQKSFGIFSKENKVRQFCFYLSQSFAFEAVVLVIIIIGSVKMVLDTYIIDYDTESPEKQASLYFDYIFTALFITEMMVKSISLGFVMEKDTYLRYSWNRLDFMVVLSQTIDLFVLSSEASFLIIFRTFRAIRPLRLISRNQQIRAVAIALFNSFKAIANVGIVLLIFWVIFSIIGVALFKGTFYYCDINKSFDRQKCESYGGKWNNQDINFDSVLNASLALFVVGSLVGWPTIMYNGIDSTSKDEAQQKDNNVWISWYFIAFILLGAFFFLNLFVAVIFERFNQVKLQQTALPKLILNRNQLLWFEMLKHIKKAQPAFQENQQIIKRWRLKLQNIVKSKYFKYVILVMVGLSAMIVILPYKGASNDYLQGIELCSQIFNFFFILEFAIKVLALDVKTYFKSKQNIFDFCIVICCVLDLFLSFLFDMFTYDTKILRLIKVTRVFRLVKFLQVLPNLKNQIITLFSSVPAVFNVFILLLLVFFIYSVLGVLLFHGTPHNIYINRYMNFDTFHACFMLLIKVSTKEEWDLIMYEAIKSNDSRIVSIYLTSFILISSFIMMNVFIMIIVDQYEDSQNNPRNTVDIFQRNVNYLSIYWQKYSNSQYLNYRNIFLLVDDIKMFIGLEQNATKNEIAQAVKSLMLKVDQNNQISFRCLIFAVLKQKYYDRNLTKQENILKFKIVEQEERRTQFFIQKNTNKSFEESSLSQLVLSKQDNLIFTFVNSVKVLDAWRRYIKKKKHKILK